MGIRSSSIKMFIDYFGQFIIGKKIMNCLINYFECWETWNCDNI